MTDLIIDNICLFASLNNPDMYILPKYSCLFVLIRKDSQEHATNSYWKNKVFFSHSIVKPGKPLKLTKLKELSLLA